MAGVCVLAFCRWAIGLAFALSAIGKATSMTSFRSTIGELKLLPPRLAGPAAIASVAAEALTAVVVAVGGVLATAGFALALALLSVFSVVLVVALRRKTEVSCNCFGPGERPISRYDLARNALLGLSCAGGMWARPGLAAHPGTGLAVTLGLAAATFLVIVTNLGDFTEVLRQSYLIS
jgi:Methylamine utilisation protein MauE